MAGFVFFETVNFRSELATLAGLGAAEQSSFQLFDLFGLEIFDLRTFTLPDGDTVQVETLFLSNFTTASFDQTTFQRFEAGSLTPSYSFTFTMGVPFDDGYDFSVVLAELFDVPTYISDAPGAVIEGFGVREEFLGEGQFLGGGGSDKIELESQIGTLGSTQGSLAAGGGGADILKAAVQNATLAGGSGTDTLVLEFGTATLAGGAGADDFILDNGFWDATGGSLAQRDAAAAGTITDFEAGLDELFFGTVGAAPLGAPQNTSFADAFNGGAAGTLADIGAQTVDGVTLDFAEDAGDVVITRKGTDGNGRSYDTTLRIENTDLADIALSDVYLQTYAANEYEFF